MSEGGGLAVAVLEEASEEDLKELMETGLLPENGGVDAGELEGFSAWTGGDDGDSSES